MTPFDAGSPADRGRASTAAPVSSNRNVLMLGTGPQVLAVPEGGRFALFNATGDIWVDYLTDEDDEDIVMPTGNITDGTAPDFNPNARFLEETITKIIVASASEDAAAMVTIQFYGA